MQNYDVIIIGAGAAGLSAAAASLNSGRRVAVLDMGASPARKVMVSGGGRCNLTNLDTGAHRYFGQNPDFVRGAIARVKPSDVLHWAHGHGIDVVEKSTGQFFCAPPGAGAVVNALMQDARGADFCWENAVEDVTKVDAQFIIKTSTDTFYSSRLIIATGGISFPALGVSDIGHKIAKQFGHKIIPQRPALCALITDVFGSELTGISLTVQIKIGKSVICDDMLITHSGIGGPAIYRATVRDLDSDMHIDLLPDIDIYSILKGAKQSRGRQQIHTILSDYLPTRFARWITRGFDKNIADYQDTDILHISTRVKDTIVPRDKIKLSGMSGAEVCRGGVDTSEVSSKTMESKLCPGLFFAGEVLDIAGDLGGFNLHWAWASGRVAGENAGLE